MSDTYKEHVNRFIVEYQDHMDDQQKARCRLMGIEPDNLWNLMWSFTTPEAADQQCKQEQHNHQKFCNANGYQQWKTFRARDLGSAVEIERTAWF